MRNMNCLRFTGNPIIDLGNSVIAMFCNKESIHDVTKEDILENINTFFDDIKNCYNYDNITSTQKKSGIMGLKQHLLKIYTTNHYLHGVNNYILDLETQKKKKVENAEEYFATFDKEVRGLLANEGATILSKEERINRENICLFCGRESDVILSKDIFPLTQGVSDINLGKVYCCSLCYMAVLFMYFSVINVRRQENSAGIYMFYHFSDEKLMIEVARQLHEDLKRSTLSSLQIRYGNRYKVIVEDLKRRIELAQDRITINKNILTTVYFLNNHNQNPQLGYINVPDGMFRFLYFMNNSEKKWEKLVSKFKEKNEYKKLVEGNLEYHYFEGIKKGLIVYLKEVQRMEESLINAIENVSKALVSYYRAKKDILWVKDFYKKTDNVKASDFISSILEYDEDNFKLNGKHLLNISDIKPIIQAKYSKSNIVHLIKYFIHEEMNNEEIEIYQQFHRERKNLV